jgi:hypothetical protein
MTVMTDSEYLDDPDAAEEALAAAAFLSHPEAVRQHLELTLDPTDRSRRTVRFVLCGPDDGVLMHCPVEEVPANQSYDECRQAVSTFAEALVHVEPDGGLLLALTRPGTASVGSGDRQWFRAAHDVCTTAGVRLLGVYLATRLELREIVLDDVLSG